MVVRPMLGNRCRLGEWHADLNPKSSCLLRTENNTLAFARIVRIENNRRAIKLGLIDDESLDGPVG